MKINWLLVLRAQQCIMSFIILGLSAYVVNWYNSAILTKSPSQVNFLVAAPLVSILSIVYIEVTPRFVKRIYSPYVAVGLDALNSIFYFSGFIALAVFLSGLFFCRGTVCGAARADTAFAAFSWVAWTVSGALAALDLFKSRKTTPTMRSQAMYAAEMKQASSQA